MISKNCTYQQAFAELEIILSKLENNELDMDQLTGQVKRASELIKFCKSKLFETESEIEKIIEDIDSDQQ